MIRPTSVNILGIDYSIEYVENASSVDVHGREVMFGQVDFWTRSIRIHDPGRDEKDIWQILLHEILHVISEALNLKLNTEEQHGELDSLATALNDVLFRNNFIRTGD